MTAQYRPRLGVCLDTANSRLMTIRNDGGDREVLEVSEEVFELIIQSKAREHRRGDLQLLGLSLTSSSSLTGEQVELR